MYNNLQTALHQKGISMQEYAMFLGVDEITAQNKVKGRIDFTYPEFKQTCVLFQPEYNADYLFANRL